MFDQNELIPVIQKENGEIAVSGRGVHTFLEVKTPYTQWIERKIEKYGFVENEEFIKKNELSQNCEGSRIVERQLTDHVLTLDMAKELAMAESNEKGKQARRYFIAVEKAWNDPVLIMGRALELSKKKVIELQRINQQNQPKVLFADAVSASKSSILVGELAKLLKQNGFDMGQKRLFEWLRENGYLIKRKGTDWNMPTQKSMDKELFEIKETAVTHSDGHVSVNKTPKVTGTGQIYFIHLFMENSTKQMNIK